MNDPNQEAGAADRPSVSTGQFDANNPPPAQPEAPITPASAAITLTPHQEKLFNSMPVGHEHARFAIDIAVDAGFTAKYGRKLIAFLHTHGIINWVSKGSTARYKKWFKPHKAQ